MKRSIAILITLTVISVGQTFAAELTDSPAVFVKLNMPFDDARDEVENAILSRGLVIDSNSKVGEMLNRTAADLGVKENAYSKAETWQFCSASLSHQLIAANPLNIAFCPFVIFSYETAQSPGEVIVGFRESNWEGSAATVAVLEEINHLLRSIINSVEP